MDGEYLESDTSEEEYTDASDLDDNHSIDDQCNAVSKGIYMKDILKILSVRSEVSYANALTLNQEMQRRLSEVRGNLQHLLRSIQKRYADNEERLQRNMCSKHRGIGIRGAYLKGGTFYYKGNMFFKDLNCRNCPNNADYERRKKEGEMFPMDSELRGRHVWSLKDKIGIVQAIKEQAINYLEDREVQTAHQRRSVKKKYGALAKKISVHTEKLASLLEKVDKNFVIDWAQISAHDLRYRHSPSSCKTMWQVYLHPSLNRSEWSLDENKRLLEAAKAYNFQDWTSIAAVVGQRSDYQCFVQYQTNVFYMLPQRWTRWDKQDDQCLLDLIERHTVNGVINWNVVASHFPQKPKTTLQQRYAYSLNPKISHAPFSPEEDLVLLAAVQEYGTKFSCFPRTLFPNRSLAQLRSRYRNTLAHRHKQMPWSIEDDRKLMEFVSAQGTSSWLQCAQLLENHNRTSCRTRFLTIQKFFEKNPKAELDDLPRKRTLTMKYSIINTENWVDKIAELRENPNADFKPKPKPRPKPKSKKRENRKIRELLKEQRAIGVTKLAQTLCLTRKKENVATGRRRVYKDSLRAVGLTMYNFFKFAYNFRLGEDPYTQWPHTHHSLGIVVNTLGFQMPENEKYVHDVTLPPLGRYKCKQLLKQSTESSSNSLGYALPPCWSTAMGFRALCIQATQVIAGETESQQFKGSAHSGASMPDDHNAVQMFRERLRNLFFNTILLSRLNPEMFENLKLSMIQVATEHQAEPEQHECNMESEMKVLEQETFEIKEIINPNATDFVKSEEFATSQTPASIIDDKTIALEQLASINQKCRKRKSLTPKSKSQANPSKRSRRVQKDQSSCSSTIKDISIDSIKVEI